MLVQSQAGEFEIEIKSFEREGGDLIMVGAMGVWEARIRVTRRDALGLAGTILKSGALWVFVAGLPFPRKKKRHAAA
jgi:hypothetical protein